ncbi:MAG: hypothetical protein LBM60_02890 [Clostridium sp.]|jgi:hypothetical protein|nr:hypothetical protein [Clostridium sp.]
MPNSPITTVTPSTPVTPIVLVVTLLGVAVALFGLFLVSKYYTWFSKNKAKLLLLLILFGILLYAVTFTYELDDLVAQGIFTRPENDNLMFYIGAALSSVYTVFRLFFFEVDAPEFDPAHSVSYMMFAILSFGILLTMSTILFSFVGYRSLCRIRMQFITLFPQRKPTYIFTALNEKALILAEDIAKTSSRIVFLMENTMIRYFSDDDKKNDTGTCDKEAIKRVLEHGFYILDMPVELTVDASHAKDKSKKRSSQFRMIAALNNSTFFANSENEHENAVFVFNFAHIHNAWRSSKHSSEPKHTVTLCPFVFNNEYNTLWVDPIFESYPLRILDEGDLAVRHLFDRDGLNLAKCIKPDDTLTILVSGYSDKISDSLYSTLAYMGQFDGVTFKMILVGDNIEDDTAFYFINNPEINKCVQIELLHLKPGSQAYYDYIRQNIHTFGCIILTDDDIRIAAALLRIRFLASCDLTICMYAPKQEQYRLLFRKENDYIRNLFFFGTDRAIYTKDIILDEGLDAIAKLFHKVYDLLYSDQYNIDLMKDAVFTDKDLEDENTWANVSLIDKRSDRALALQAVSKLYRLGITCKYVKREGEGNNPIDVADKQANTIPCEHELTENGKDLYKKLISDTSLLDQLARGEHMRWNAFLFANGWRTKTTYDPANTRTRKDAKQRTHALLVEWEELQKISKEFGINYTVYDYAMLRNIGVILETAGYQLSKNPEGR